MRHLYTLLFCICLGISASAQSFSIDSLFARMERQAMTYPAENLYLHTDRSMYMAGDTVWIKAYVVEGITNVPAKQSRYVYVVLQNPFKEIVEKVCLRADGDGFIHGNLPLTEDLPKGEYTICAYTAYMGNEGEETFFRKRIVINNVKNKNILLETNQRGTYLDIRFVNPVTDETIKVRNCRVTSPSGGIGLLKKDNGYSVKIHESKNRILLVQAGNYEEYVSLDVKPDYDVSFHPESGSLLAGVFNRVAFKSINTSGQGENVTGTIRDERDSVLFEFKSLHRGMGTFGFVPEMGKKYEAVCVNHTGQTRRFVLPAPSDTGHGLQVNRINSSFFVKLLVPNGKEPLENLYLLAHQKGWPIMIHPYKPGNSTYVFDVGKFLPGTVSFLLINDRGMILNERMAFVKNGLCPEGSIRNDSRMYGKREKVSLELSVKGSDGKKWNGECSVSVTDNNDVLPDTCTNILARLLLESGLSGHIEEPAWYFRSGNERYREQALDALMLTQGWKRYDLAQTWRGDFRFPSIRHEESQSMTGKVTKRISRRPVPNAGVQMMIPSLGEVQKTVTADDGTFRFSGFEYPDSTMYWVSAYTEKGKENVVVELDTVIQPALKDMLPPYRKENMLSITNRISGQYLEKTDLRIIQEKGMRHVFLDEVLVTAPKIVPRTEYEKLINTKTIRLEEIEKSGVNDIGLLLQQKFPGVSIGGDGYVRIRGDKVTFMLNGTVLHNFAEDPNNPGMFNAHQFILSMYKGDIEQIDKMDGIDALAYDPMAGGCIIAITTKGGDSKYNAKWDPTNLKDIMPLGFQLPSEFYSPRYEFTQDKDMKTQDLRTTIHWQPRLKVKDGKAEFEFYTADSPVDYTVIIEGVGEDGSLLRVEERIRP